LFIRNRSRHRWKEGRCEESDSSCFGHFPARHSLFTYYFLKGLQGAADERGDGKITVAEMDAYLKKNVPYMAQRLGGNEQTPVITGNAGEVIAVLKK